MKQYTDEWLWAGEAPASRPELAQQACDPGPPKEARPTPAASAPAEQERAVRLYREGQFEEACALLRQTVDLAPSWLSRLALGFTLLELHRAPEALEEFEQCLATRPEDENATLGRAAALQAMHRREEAYGQYISLASRSGRDAEALANLVCTAGDPAAAEEHGRRLLAVDPHSAPALSGMAAAAMGREDYEAAARWYGQLAELMPDANKAWYNLGVALQRGGRHTEAAGAYRRSIQLTPECDEAHVNLGAALHHVGDFAAAHNEYARAINSERPGLLWNDALAHDALGEFEQAEAALDRLTKLRPEWAEAWSRLGRVRFGLGRWDSAAQALDHSAELSPSPATYANAGVTHYRAGRTDQAIRAFERALEADPACTAALRGLAAIAADRGDAPRALEYWRRFASQGAADPDLAFNVGSVAYDSGDRQSAGECFRAAIDAQPALADALINLMHAVGTAGRG